ncbi:MAG TPA: SRPBCC family protein [Planctomycetota bacterium]|nr:SRPBCC family protein [Planctomycetota bacterium]
MAAKNNRAEAEASREIVTVRVFDAPRELVFAAWTEPKQVAQWWGPNGFTTTIQTMDVRPGGAWNLVMHGPDGTDYPNKSVYVEVVRPEKIVFDHLSGPQFRMTATFEEQGGKTKVTMRGLFNTATDYEVALKKFGAVEGAKQTLARLGEHLAKQR